MPDEMKCLFRFSFSLYRIKRMYVFMWLRLLGWAWWVYALFMYVNLRAHKRVYIYSFRWVLAAAEVGIIWSNEKFCCRAWNHVYKTSQRIYAIANPHLRLTFFLASHKATHNFIYVQLYLATANIYITFLELKCIDLLFPYGKNVRIHWCNVTD